jgi:hypothetical protein
MPSTIRKVSYAYVTAASKPGEAARILNALRDAKVNLLRRAPPRTLVARRRI